MDKLPILPTLQVELPPNNKWGEKKKTGIRRKTKKNHIASPRSLQCTIEQFRSGHILMCSKNKKAFTTKRTYFGLTRKKVYCLRKINKASVRRCDYIFILTQQN